MCIKGDPVRFVGFRGLDDDARVLGERAHQAALALVGELAEIGLSQRLRREVEGGKGHERFGESSIGAPPPLAE